MSDAAVEQRVGEFHLYSLPGRSTLLPGQTTSVALFEPAQVKYEHNYIVHGDVPYWGFLPQQGEQVDLPVEVTYTLKRPRKTSFGDRPLPGGVGRLYQADSAGSLQLVGEASLDHTAPGNDLRLKAGNAFDLSARRVQMNYVTRRDQGARSAHRCHGRLPGDPEECAGQHRHHQCAGRARRRVERGDQLGTAGKSLFDHNSVSGAGAGARRGGAELQDTGDMVSFVILSPSLLLL